MDDQNKKNDRIRAAVYPMAGFYLIYQACCMYKEFSAEAANPNTLMIVSAAFLVVAGIGLMIFGFMIGYKISKNK